ncbi:transient receptor potential channel pyrexia [Condylostylus longicornis]|uniref:transient receptor potential channel pyrexia n=1 Tax=Condylostylus longicornis TaxID=2530218 RepID=UPI00244DFEDD|nr:transient receptor potential channel pyrexia [Condylostylus longicornis]
MENLGYKEGTAKTRRINRTSSVLAKNEQEAPLSGSNRFKTVSPGMMVRWRNDPESMIEAQYPTSDFEYMECGPSPPAESAPSMYDSFEEPTSELSVLICHDTLRNSLIDQMKAAGGRMRLFEEIENGNIISENVQQSYENTTKIEKNLSYLWSSFLKRWDLLEGLILCGAELNFYDQNGISALHLAAFSGCLASTNFLISKKLDVNLQPKTYTPLHCAAFGNSPETAKMLINNGALITKDTTKPNCEESLLHCAVRANSLECVQLFITEGADVNSLKPNGTNPIHLAADLGLSQCLEALLNAEGADPNIRICIREKESTALHLAADEGNCECVDLLLAKGADAKLKNHRGFTALHLAARTSSLECVESLLRNGNADPNAEDFDQRTPLHTAVGKSENAFDIMETLISWGANVNHKDIYGFTALHLAALDGLAQCVEMLIYHGADVTTKSKKGTTALNVITRKTPASVAMIQQKLDAAITLHHSQDIVNREVELELDFRQLLQHCHPREISYLNTFVDEGQKEILEHPLCSAFLYIKWGKIRKYYIGRLIFCFTFVLFLTLYVLTALAHNCYNGSKDDNTTILAQELCQKQSILGDMLRNNPFVMEMQWWVLVAITIIEIFRKLYGITGYTSVRQYFMQVENSMEWFVITSVFVISYIYTKQTYTFQNHIGAFAVLLGWTNLMLMIGQLPVFDVYVAMYTKVQGEFAKLFMAYSCMLVGFTISFCVIFPSSSSFANPFMGFITVLVMMIGEQDLSLLINDPDGKDPPFLLEISAQITFVLFLLFVTIILMNLLVGIAVHDIQGLKKTAGLSKLVRQTKLISYIESALFNGYLPTWLRNLLHYTALVSPQAYRVVLCVKPLNPSEKRLPRDILMNAYEVGKQRKHNGHTISAKSSAATYFSYKNKYNNNNSNGNNGNNGSSSNMKCNSYLQSGPHTETEYDTMSLCTLTTKIDDNAERLDQLTTEIQELKAALFQQQQQATKVIDKLLLVISNQQQRNNFKK